MTKPENFRRDREWPCCVPDCKRVFHTSEQAQIHFKLDHTPEEKDAAWAKVPAFFAERNKTYTLTLVKTPWDKFDVPSESGVIRFDQS